MLLRHTPNHAQMCALVWLSLRKATLLKNYGRGDSVSTMSLLKQNWGTQNCTHTQTSKGVPQAAISGCHSSWALRQKTERETGGWRRKGGEGWGWWHNEGSQGDRKQTVQMRLRSLMNWCTVKVERRGEAMKGEERRACIIHAHELVRGHRQSCKPQQYYTS